jgi:hypothetical protein
MYAFELVPEGQAWWQKPREEAGLQLALPDEGGLRHELELHDEHGLCFAGPIPWGARVSALRYVQRESK